MAKKREKIKTDILRIAKKKFAEAGYEATNIQDIANEAQINIAMISYYFGGKEQ
uniref:TetR family transcriptional regulator n=1 Tax=Bacillus thuringiensis TaxID=1428 RepID=UPI0011A822BB